MSMKKRRGWFGGLVRSGRRPAAPAASEMRLAAMPDGPTPTRFPEGARCGAGCGKTSGHRCAYRDDQGNRCGWWCLDHAVILDGQAWCRRHASNTKWLRAKGGSILAVGRRPHVNDRSPNLVGILVDEYNDEVIAYLRSCFGSYPGLQIVTDEGIRSSSVPKGRVERSPDGPIVLSEGRHMSWARGWAVYSSVGYLVRVVLQVIAGEPPVVHMYVNGHSVVSRVPDWIANRHAGTDPLEDRALFRRVILDSMRAAVAAHMRTFDHEALMAGRQYN